VLIPGTRNPGHIDSNAAAVDVRLSPEDLRRIDQMPPVGPADGEAQL
jgi:diketogulonate reductase-like aldo/keto reductase